MAAAGVGAGQKSIKSENSFTDVDDDKGRISPSLIQSF